MVALNNKKESSCASCLMPFEYDSVKVNRKGRMEYYDGTSVVAVYIAKGLGSMTCEECGIIGKM